MILLLVYVVELLFILEGAKSTNSNGAVIILSSSNTTESNYIVKNVDDALELTCLGNDVEKSVSWFLPENTHKRVFYSEGSNGSVTLSIGHLAENDSGEYKCGLQQDDVLDKPCSYDNQCSTNNPSFSSVYVYVKKKSCLGFQCSPNLCILERFVCDGKQDCANNEDESLRTCGADPCENKIKCPNGRCIPQEWCCINVKNCTRKWDVNCCPNTKRDKTGSMKYLGSPAHFRDDVYQSYDTPGSIDVHLPTGMSLLQTLIHTVIGCALVLVVIGPILVVAGCKLYTRHRTCSMGTTLSSVPRISSPNTDRNTGFPSVAYHLPLTNEVTSAEELDSLAQYPWDLERPLENCDGFRISQLQAPPPYCEVMLTHDDDPPPPYMPSDDAEEGSPCKEKGVPSSN